MSRSAFCLLFWESCEAHRVPWHVGFHSGTTYVGTKTRQSKRRKGEERRETPHHTPSHQIRLSTESLGATLLSPHSATVALEISGTIFAGSPRATLLKAVIMTGVPNETPLAFDLVLVLRVLLPRVEEETSLPDLLLRARLSIPCWCFTSSYSSVNDRMS